MALRKCVFVEPCHDQVVPIPFDEMGDDNPCKGTFTYNVSLDEERTINVRTGGLLGKPGDLIIPPIKFTSMIDSIDVPFNSSENYYNDIAQFKKNKRR